MQIYLASPLGFATSTRAFMTELAEALASHVDVNNPWDEHSFDAEIEQALMLDSVTERYAALHRIDMELGRKNEELIRESDQVVAVLDGVDVDSGTASEIGFAYGLGKRIDGLRTDFRLAGDNPGSTVNLQVEYFIEASGGQIVSSIGDLIDLFGD